MFDNYAGHFKSCVTNVYFITYCKSQQKTELFNIKNCSTEVPRKIHYLYLCVRNLREFYFQAYQKIYYYQTII